MKSYWFLFCIVILTLATLTCCDCNHSKFANYGYGIHVVEIDDCEYIVNTWRGGIVHKANCKNLIHKYGETNG